MLHFSSVSAASWALQGSKFPVFRVEIWLSVIDRYGYVSACSSGHAIDERPSGSRDRGDGECSGSSAAVLKLGELHNNSMYIAYALVPFPQIFPQAWNRKRLQAPSDENEAGVLCVPAKAGDAVVFLSK